MKRKSLLIIIFSSIIISCSTSQQSTNDAKNKNPEIYIFDDVSKLDTTKISIDSTNTDANSLISEKKSILSIEGKEKTGLVSIKYIVQVGAFSSKERAEIFVSENQNKIKNDLNIIFNLETNLFVVQLPSFETYESAETTRDIVRKVLPFRDAFIITIEE